MPTYLLGIDSGCTMSKAALFTLKGDELAVAARKTEVLSPRPGILERDVPEMWRATVETIREVLAKAKISPGDIACVATTGHGNGIYLVDQQGAPARNAILSTDSRARGYIDRWLREGVDKAVHPKTMQSLWPGQPNALIAWLQDNEPDVLQRARWVLMAKDYIRFQLTGEIHAELTDMSGTSLLNVRDASYDRELLAAFGIEDAEPLLPPLKLSADLCGRVTSEAASATGLKEGTLVAGGMFDIDACGLASGLVDEDALCVIAGTWGNNQYVSKNPVVSENVFMTSRYAIPDYYLMLEGSATSASNLEWFVTEFFAAEAKAAHERGSSVYELCNELVSATPSQDSGIVFLPFLYGSNAHPEAKACFIGLQGWHTRGEVLRAIYEGVVFSHKTHIDRLMQFRQRPETLRLTGGAARSEVWLQMFADCLQIPVEASERTELGALGAAICASVTAGCHASYEEAIEKMVRFSRVQEPNAQRQEHYEAKYTHYRRVLDALEPLWGSSS